MESFYGGRQGASFVIKGSFKFITDKKVIRNGKEVFVDEYYGQAYDEYLNWDNENTTNPTGYSTKEEWLEELNKNTMTVQLNRSDYKDVWYGEYCIIDPDNKNSRNNGKIFRRTLKGAGDEDLEGACAEYIGQIVGPAGPTPHLKDITGVDATEQGFQDLTLGLDDTVRFWNQSDEWDESKNTDDKLKVHSLGNEIKMLPGSTLRKKYTSHPEYFKSKNNTNMEYLQQGGYNWYDVRLNTSTDDLSQIYIGFDFPYYVTDFVSGVALPDVSNPKLTRQINSDEDPFGTAPFYEKYRIDVPRGLRGAWFDDIRVEKRKSTTVYHLPQSIEYVEPTETIEDKYQIKSGAKAPTTTVWPIDAEGWVATFHWRAQGDPLNVVNDIENVYLGIHRDISNITFDDSGTLTIYYSGWNGTLPQTQTWDKKVDWIKKIEISDPVFKQGSKKTDLNSDNASITEGSNLKFTFNNDTVNVNGEPSQTLEYNLRTIAGIKMFDDGSVRFYRSDKTTDDFEKQVNWIESAEVTPTNLTETTGDTLKINFNNDNIENISKNLRLINNMTLKENGVLEITHSDGSKRASEGVGGVSNLGSRINWITEVYRTNANDSVIINKSGETLSPHHLLIRFNNPEPGIVTNLTKVTYKGKNDWYDLGVVQEVLDGLFFNDSSVRVEYNPNESYEDVIDKAIQTLNNSEKYGQGTPEVDGQRLGQKALPVTLITKDKNGNILSTDVSVFYYDSGVDTGTSASWKVLGKLESSNASVVIDGTGQAPSSTALRFKTTTLISNTLDTPWSL